MNSPRFLGWDAYDDSVVDIDVGDRQVTLAREGVLAGGPLATPLHVITAYNPGGAAPDGENATAQRALEDTLSERGVSYYLAIGRSRDHSWREPSVAAAGLSDEEAIAIGRAFRQDAIFLWDGESLRVIACRDRDN
ncbi:MAG: DUF3293 domain-containing protein [Marmoricola sp.]